MHATPEHAVVGTGAPALSSGTGKRYKGSTTIYVVITCIVAASGGGLFGYDNGRLWFQLRPINLLLLCASLRKRLCSGLMLCHALLTPNHIVLLEGEPFPFPCDPPTERAPDVACRRHWRCCGNGGGCLLPVRECEGTLHCIVAYMPTATPHPDAC